MELHVDVIHIFHQVDGLTLADILVESATESVGDIVFSIGKSTGTTETAHDGTALTVDATLDLVTVDRTVALLQRVTGFENGNFQVGILLHQFISGEDTAGTGTDNDYVIFHRDKFPFSLFSCKDLWDVYSF